jgi:hypothetical protein
MKTTAIDVLTELLQTRTIPAVRVSALGLNYRGATRYEIRLGRDGRPTNRPFGKATNSRRRSGRLALKDAEALAER